MTIDILRGDCRKLLPELPPGSVQTTITTPPYWSKRDYEVPPLVWGGDPAHDPHSFKLGFQPGQHTGYGDKLGPPRTQTGWCECGAWYGPLGLEPGVNLYIEHLSECIHYLRRPLAADGTLWLSIGDSYHNKSLVEAPSLLALALRSQGWLLRARLPWIKPGAGHERPAHDRPSGSIDYLFLFAKNSNYLYDPKAALLEGSAARVTDLFHATWRGLLLDADSEPLALYVNQQHVKLPDDHYALFPNKLIEPLVACSSRKGDTVLDMFGGVGTTGKIAHEMGRQAVVCELHPRFVSLAREYVARS